MAFDTYALTPDTPVFRDITTVILRKWKIIVLIFLGVFMGTYLGLMFVTEQYEAEARLLVKLGRENTQVPLTVDKGGVFATGVQKEEINSYIQLLTSRDLLRSVVDEMGVERFLFAPQKPENLLQAIKYYLKQTARWIRRQIDNTLILLNLRKSLSDKDKVIKLVKRSLKAARERDSNVIRVSIQLPDRELAENFLTTLLDEYLKRHVDLRRNVDVGEVFEAETNAYRKQLNTLQHEILLIKDQWNLSSIESQRTAMINRLEDFRSVINQRKAELARLKSEEISLQATLATQPKQSISEEIQEPNQAFRKIRGELVALQIKRAHLETRYKGDTEQIDLIDQEIAALKILQENQPASEAGQRVYSQDKQNLLMRQQLTDNHVRQAGIIAELAKRHELEEQLIEGLRRLNEGESHLRIQELEWKVLEQKYTANATRREEARIAEALDLRRVVNVAILSPPTSAPEPVKPRKGIIMVVAMILGLLLGVAIALLREWSRGIIYSGEDLEELGDITLLGEFQIA